MAQIPNPDLIPKYSSEHILMVAEERISNSRLTDDKVYEYNVGSWMCTMISRHFGKDFLITPEMFNIQTNRKPDFTIEKLDQESANLTKFHAACEIKKHHGEHLEKALDQLVKAIRLICDETGITEIFLIVQRGLEIGFFEFSPLLFEDLDEQKIDHFRGCVPLTFYNDNIISDNGVTDRLIKEMTENLQGVKHLLYRNTKKSNDPEIEELLQDADSLQTPCIFNLEKHKYEIDLMFHHIATANPREIGKL